MRKVTFCRDGEKISYARQLLEYFRLSELVVLPDVSGCNSYSEIKLLITDKARKHLLSQLS